MLPSHINIYIVLPSVIEQKETNGQNLLINLNPTPGIVILERAALNQLPFLTKNSLLDPDQPRFKERTLDRDSFTDGGLQHTLQHSTSNPRHSPMLWPTGHVPDRKSVV